MNPVSSTRRLGALALTAFCLSVTTGAQQAPPAPPKPAQEPPSQEGVVRPGQGEQATFRATVQYVTTDAIVRDDNGQFVADLTKDDFEVFEDGIRHDLSTMQLIHGGRVYSHLTAPPPPVAEGIILPPARPTNDAAGRIFLLVVDDLHLDFRNTPRIRQLFDKIKKTLIHEGDMFGIVSTGPSSIAIDMTYDRMRLDEAIRKISGSALKPSEILSAPEGAQGPAELRYRAHVAFSTAYDIMQNLEKVTNRRKAVIYVSNGYDFDPFPETRSGFNPRFPNQGNPYRPDMGRPSGGNSDGYGSDTSQDYTNPFLRQGQQFADADLAHELAELTRAANRANASLYTIDPRGLVGGPDLDENIDPVEYQNHVRKTQDSLRVLAELTGGIAVVNQNDFDKALKRIDQETSDYYILGYYSQNPDPTKRTRRIEVKIKRKNVQVWSRKSYSLKANQPPAEKKPTKSTSK
jgi:VWFA-related protein